MLTGIEKGFSLYILAEFQLKIVVLRLNNTQIIASIIFIKFHRLCSYSHRALRHYALTQEMLQCLYVCAGKLENSLEKCHVLIYF